MWWGFAPIMTHRSISNRVLHLRSVYADDSDSWNRKNSSEKLNWSKRFIPTIARLCIMASTLEDSLRYWREYGIYINYFGNLWTKERLIFGSTSGSTSGLNSLKIDWAMISNLEAHSWNQIIFWLHFFFGHLSWRLFRHFYWFQIFVLALFSKNFVISFILCHSGPWLLFRLVKKYNLYLVHHLVVAESLSKFILSLDHKGYPGGRNWNLWQIQHTAKFWAAISLVYAEACEESNSMFAGLPSLGHVWANICTRVLTDWSHGSVDQKLAPGSKNVGTISDTGSI